MLLVNWRLHLILERYYKALIFLLSRALRVQGGFQRRNRDAQQAKNDDYALI